MAHYIAAYDFGTSGVKAVIYRENGHICGIDEQAYGISYPQPGYVEQDPQEYWDAVCRATGNAMAQSGVAPREVRGVVFSVQAVNLIPVSADGEILYPAVSWLDGRAERQAEEINRHLGAPLVRAQDFQSRLMWFREELPDLYDRAKVFLDCNTFLQYKATGILTLPEDHPGRLSHHPALQAYFDATMEAAGVTGKLAVGVEATKVYGPLSAQGAAELGLIEGTPVFGGCIDVPESAAGAGCLQEGDDNVYLGTSGWLSVLVREPVEAAPGSYYVGSIHPDLLIYGGCINSCCMAVNWCRDLMYSNEVRQLGAGVWDVINEEMAAVPPGCDGLLAAPWLFGEQFPVSNPNLRGTFVGAAQRHTRAHFIAAIVESICMSIRWQVEHYQKDHGRPVTKVTVNGGGSLSDPWMQRMADILQLPVQVPEQTRHSGAVGAALAAAIGLGICTFDNASQLITMERTYQPRWKLASLYDQQFRRFQALYQIVAPFYDDAGKEAALP